MQIACPGVRSSKGLLPKAASGQTASPPAQEAQQRCLAQLDFRTVKPVSDQYSVAAPLYNLLTNKFVYDLSRNVNEQLLMILQDAPVPIQARRADLPNGLPEVIGRALAREPKDRFPDVKALREALAKFCP